MHPIDKIDGFTLIKFTKEEKEFLLANYCSKFRGRHVFENLLYYIEKLLCKTVLIEENYIDKDFRSEYSVLYSKTFKRFDSLCTRLHFFNRNFCNINEIKGLTCQERKGCYLGYTIIRPLDVGKVGRTIIKPWIKNVGESYPLCQAPAYSHLFGIEFEIHGCPFIQQDTMVMSCAQASLWMGTRYMSLCFGFQEFLPSEITEEATKYFTLLRSLPTEGLVIYSMFNALRNMGYSPIYFESNGRNNKNGWDPVNSIYKYIESCIPVIVTVPEHAFIIIGHTFSPKRYSYSKIRKNLEGFNTVSSEEWIDAFIIHDDAIGPYRLLPVSKKDRNNLIKKGFKDLLAPDGWLYQTVDDIDGIIVPLPQKVYILAEHIPDIVDELFGDTIFLQELSELVKKNNAPPLAKEFLKSLFDKKNPVVLRSYIIQATKYKQSLKREPLSKELNKTVIETYEKLPMSNYIWVVELSNAKRFSNHKQTDRKIFGEIIIDATGNRYGLSFLSLHLPGLLILHDIEKKEFNMTPILDDNEYRHSER